VIVLAVNDQNADLAGALGFGFSTEGIENEGDSYKNGIGKGFHGRVNCSQATPAAKVKLRL
jgi:hypothetical protein